MAEENTENPIKEIYKSLMERISSPITGVFILTWLLVNWHIPVILIFGTIPEQDRIKTIEEYIHRDKDPLNLFNNLLIPLFLTAMYLVIVPVIRDLYENFLRTINYQKSKKDILVEQDLKDVAMYKDSSKEICINLLREVQKQHKANLKIFELLNAPLKQPARHPNLVDIQKIAIESRTSLGEILVRNKLLINESEKITVNLLPKTLTPNK